MIKIKLFCFRDHKLELAQKKEMAGYKSAAASPHARDMLAAGPRAASVRRRHTCDSDGRHRDTAD